MKAISIFIILFLTTAPLHADRVGQGAGIAENNIFFAYEYMDNYLEICLNLNTCVEDENEREVIKKILKGLRAAEDQEIVFKSHQREPIFFIDGQVRVAKTWGYVDAPIYFNTDQLYWVENGRIVGITIPTAVALLVHELGHNHGVTDHAWLDRLGQRVGRIVGSELQSDFLTPRPGLRALSLNFDHSPETAQTQVLLSDGYNLADVTPLILETFRCPQAQDESSELVGLVLWNFVWLDPMSPRPSLLSYATPYCRNGAGGEISSPEGYVVKIQMEVFREPVSGKWTFNFKQFGVKQSTCAAEPRLCHLLTQNERRFQYGPEHRAIQKPQSLDEFLKSSRTTIRSKK